VTYEKPFVVDTDLLSCFAQVKQIDIITKLFPNIILLEIVWSEIKDAPNEISEEVKNYVDSNEFIIDNIYYDSKMGSKFLELIYNEEGINDGEAAVMAYCTYKKAIVGSNNLKDVHKYCVNNRIELRTFACVMLNGYEEKLFSENEGNKIWTILKEKGNLIPFKTFTEVIKNWVPIATQYFYDC
jgi:predicted nucleic acid-binding protein